MKTGYLLFSPTHYYDYVQVCSFVWLSTDLTEIFALIIVIKRKVGRAAEICRSLLKLQSRTEESSGLMQS